MLPQLTRTVKLADELSTRLAAPIDQVVPGLDRARRDAELAGADVAADRSRRVPRASSTTCPGGCRRSPSSPSRPAACSGCASPACAAPARRRASAGDATRPDPSRPAEGAGEEGAGQEAPAKKAPAKKRGGARRRLRPGRPALTTSARSSAADERRRHDGAGQRRCRARRSSTAAPLADGRRDEGEGDAVAEHRREVAARDLADGIAVDERRRTRRAAGGGPRWRCRRGGGATPALPLGDAAPRGRGTSALSHATTQPSPACSGVMPGPSSWPCSGRPASRRSVSRAPSPAGLMPAPTIAVPQRSAAASAGTAISTPRSPV